MTKILAKNGQLLAPVTLFFTNNMSLLFIAQRSLGNGPQVCPLEHGNLIVFPEK